MSLISSNPCGQALKHGPTAVQRLSSTTCVFLSGLPRYPCHLSPAPLSHPPCSVGVHASRPCLYQHSLASPVCVPRPLDCSMQQTASGTRMSNVSGYSNIRSTTPYEPTVGHPTSGVGRYVRFIPCRPYKAFTMILVIARPPLQTSLSLAPHERSQRP